MSDNSTASARVVEVLLADGWHRIVPGSFCVGRMGLAADVDLSTPGFRFEEAAPGSPHRPTVLTGPIGSIVAVRQVAQARTVGDLHSRVRTRPRAAEERWQAV